MPVVVRPEPFVGMELALGQAADCKGAAAGVSYRLFAGLNATIRMDPLNFKLWRWEVTLGDRILPKGVTLQIVKKASGACTHCTVCCLALPQLVLHAELGTGHGGLARSFRPPV